MVKHQHVYGVMQSSLNQLSELLDEKTEDEECIRDPDSSLTDESVLAPVQESYEEILTELNSLKERVQRREEVLQVETQRYLQLVVLNQ